LHKARENNNIKDIFLKYKEKVDSASQKINHANEVLSNPNLLKKEEKIFQSSYIYNLYIQDPNQAALVAKSN